MTAFFIGFAAALLTGLGVGSGGLLILYLTAFTDIPQLSAQMINLVFYVAAALPATLFNVKKKRITLLPFCLLSLFALLGILPGLLLSIHLSPTVLRKCFGALMGVLGFWGLIRKKK